MKDAICWFACAVAAMRKWGYKKPISMLIHTSQKQAHHDIVAQTISRWINNAIQTDEFILRCNTVYHYETTRLPKSKWIDQIPNYGIPAEEIRDYPKFEEILPEIKELISEKIQHIKLSESGDLEYHKSFHLVIDKCSKNGVNPSPAPAFIIVGGSTLSRGLTIEGLVSTFFLRASCQADTLMQMGRWFGYRRNYELLPRIWMTADTMEKFRFLSELEVDLREDLRKYMRLDVTPIEYGPRILSSPKVSWLRLTSRGHMVNAKAAEMDFSGARPQTAVFDKDIEIQKRNINITENFIKKLGMPFPSADNVSLYWKNIPLDLIMKDLLINKFSFCNRSRVFNEIAAFCDWIKQLSHEQELNNWTVIVGGNGKLKANCRVPEDDKHWIIGNYQIGKVERSRRKPLGEIDDTIDIGVLRSIKDQLADVDKQYMDEV